MIANITKGRKAVGAILYDFGPGRRDEHVNPRIVAGNVTGTPMQVARAIDHTARLRPEITAPIWRTSLSLPDEDGILPDGQWSAIAADFIREMGFDGAPWVAVRHGDDHVHLTVSRVDWSGQLLTDRHDYRRAREAADRLEQQHGLVPARERFRAEGPQVRNNELEAARRRGRDHGTAMPPEREDLRRIVREVAAASRGLGREAFEAGLTEAGVSFRANVASTGRMNGYSFTLAGWTDGADEPVWVAASRVARDLRWAQLHQVLGDGPARPQIPDPRIAFAAQAGPAETVLQRGGPPRAELAEAAERGAEILRRGQAERGILPAPEQPAARSTDPASALLAQWRAVADGQQQPVEDVPAAAPEVPVWTDKARRPHGRLSKDGLAAAIRRKEKELATLVRSKAAAEAEIRTGDAIATGQITGPYVQDLHQLLARLEEAEPHIVAARQHREILHAAEEATTRARADWREADTRQRASRWELWRLGTSRAAERRRAEDASETIGDNTEAATAARTAGAQASETARQQTGVPDPGAELARVREGWADLVGEAHGRDQAHGTARRSNGQRDAARHGAAIVSTQQRLVELREEQALRQTMPDGQRRAEGRARSAAAQAALPTSRRGPATGRSPHPGYEQPAHLRRPPPDRGRGHGLS